MMECLHPEGFFSFPFPDLFSTLLAFFFVLMKDGNTFILLKKVMKALTIVLI